LKCISRLDKGFKPLVRIAQLRKSYRMIFSSRWLERLTAQGDSSF